MEFRKLKSDEIEARVAQVGKGWAQLLLYKNARVDMTILDETVGAERWQREHYECKGNLFCKVGIYCNDLGWIWKSDCGAESNTEKEKGEASDSFKRACTNWGIGRELYTSPTIFVNLETEERNGKHFIKDKKTRFKVDYINYENGKITELIITDNNGRKVFTKLNDQNKQDKQDDQAEKEEQKCEVIKYKRVKRV